MRQGPLLFNSIRIYSTGPKECVMDLFRSVSCRLGDIQYNLGEFSEECRIDRLASGDVTVVRNVVLSCFS